MGTGTSVEKCEESTPEVEVTLLLGRVKEHKITTSESRNVLRWVQLYYHKVNIIKCLNTVISTIE